MLIIKNVLYVQYKNHIHAHVHQKYLPHMNIAG